MEQKTKDNSLTWSLSYVDITNEPRIPGSKQRFVDHPKSHVDIELTTHSKNSEVITINTTRAVFSLVPNQGKDCTIQL